MTKTKGTPRVRYTLEFSKRRCVWSRAARASPRWAEHWGVVDQTLHNWVKARREGKLKGAQTPSR